MGAVAKETDLGLLRQVLPLCGVHNQKKRRRERAYNGSDGSNSSRSSLMSNSSECERIRQYSKRDKSMREAIQHHITDLVKSLLFKECNIPDLIIEHGIANENDAAKIRQLSTTEDQVSALVSHVLDCDYNGMDSFLKMITEDYSQLEKKIRDMFDTIHNDIDEDAMPCAGCELKARCNVKHVYNYLFEKQMISKDMHRFIAYMTYPVKKPADVWDDVLKELSNYPNQLAIDVLIQAFDQHDGHSNATTKLMLKRLFRKDRPLTCRCDNAPSLSSSPASTLPFGISIGSMERVNEDMATGIASNSDNQDMATGIARNRNNLYMATGIASNSNNQDMATGIASNSNNQDMATGIASNSGNQDMATGIARNRDNLYMATSIASNSDNQDMATGIASNSDNQDMATGIASNSNNQDMATGIAINTDNQDMATGIARNRHNQDMAIGVASNCPKQRMATDNVNSCHIDTNFFERNVNRDFVINTDEKALGMTSFDTAKGSYCLGIDRSEYTERQNISKLQQAQKASEIPDQSQMQYPAYAPVEALSATDNRLAHDGKHFLFISKSNSMAQKLESPPMSRVSDMDSDMKYDNVPTNFKEAGQSERKEKKFLRKPYNIGRLKEISRKEWKGKENLSQ